jgi:hypothetical protein
VFWYPKPERLVIDATQYALPDPRDADLERLSTALRRVRTLAGDAPTLATVTDPATILETIYQLADGALAGAEPEPSGVTVEAMVI